LPAHAQRMSSLFSLDKEFAPCRVGGRGTCEAGRGAGREAGQGVRRWRRKRHARGKPDSRLLGARARAERTANMPTMSVTLEVSRLSGWLNARPSCRVEGRGTCTFDAGRGAGQEVGGLEAAAAQAACSGKARLKAVGGQGTRGAHVEHVAHVRDLGGVKAQRLVERARALPSRREGHAMRGEVRAGRWEGVRRRRRKRHARGKARLKV